MARAKRKEAATAADEGTTNPESAAVQRWQEKITAADEAAESRNAEIQRNREYAKGTIHDDGKPGLVRTNLIQVNMQSIVPHVYAKNPEIAISPTAAVTKERYPVMRKFAETFEAVLDRMFILDTQLKKRARSNLYSVRTSGEGWLKMVYQRDYATDPMMKGRIQDSQDNIARLEKMLADIQDERQQSDIERQKYELQKMLESLNQQVEVVAAEGLIIDRVLTDDMRILDQTLFDFDYYVYAAQLAQRVWMSKDDYCAEFGEWPEQGAPTLYEKPQRSKQDNKSDATATKGKGAKQQLVAVWEIWDRLDGNVKTLATGAKRFCREPFTPERRPQRWFPFYRLGWNFVDGDVRAIPDVSTERELQDEYNTTRTNFADHRKASIPVTVVRTGSTITQEDVDRIQNRKINQILAIEGATTAKLTDDIAALTYPPIDPAVYDVGPIRTDMEMVAGRGDADAGTVQNAKTATEAELLQQGMTSRSDFRRDLTEDLIQEMAQDAAEILLQEITLPQVQQIAGEGAVWPEMSKDEIFNLVQIQIRAGSTGKPNKNKEQEQWQTILPILQNAFQQVFELRAQGQFELANAIVKLIDETLTRFDERFDLEEFLGPMDEDGQAQQKQQSQMMQQLQQLQQENEQMKADAAKVDQTKQAALEADVQLKQMQIAKMQPAPIENPDAPAIEAAAKAEQERQKRADASHEAEMDRSHQSGLEHAKMSHDAVMKLNDQAHEMEMLAMNKLADQLRAATDALTQDAQGDAAENDAADAQKDDELRATIAAIGERMDMLEQSRQRRADAVLEFLSGPKDEVALASTIDRIRGGTDLQ